MRRRDVWSAGLEHRAGSSSVRGRPAGGCALASSETSPQVARGEAVCLAGMNVESQGGGSKEIWGALAGKWSVFPAATRVVGQLGLGFGISSLGAAGALRGVEVTLTSQKKSAVKTLRGSI